MKEFIPSKFYLSQNAPNPFSKETKIKYCLPVKSKVHLVIYNAEGDMIEVLVNKTQKPGTYEEKYKNHQKINGTYFYSMKARGLTMKIIQTFDKTKKMIVTK